MVSIVYSSVTGNTKLLADSIKNYLDGKVAYFGKPGVEALASDKIYVGFWTDKGEANKEALDFLRALNNKKIFLFGTAGFGVSDEYFNKIIERTKEAINDSNEVIGSFMCQGKMPQSVKDRYLKMKESGSKIPNIDLLIDNFNKALAHPNSDDITNLLNTIKQ